MRSAKIGGALAAGIAALIAAQPDNHYVPHLTVNDFSTRDYSETRGWFTTRNMQGLNADERAGMLEERLGEGPTPAFLLGLHHLQSDDRENAEQYFRLAREQAPNNAHLRLSLANYFFVKTQEPNARDEDRLQAIADYRAGVALSEGKLRQTYQLQLAQLENTWLR